MNEIIKIDRNLLLFINPDQPIPGLDSLMILVSSHFFWGVIVACAFGWAIWRRDWARLQLFLFTLVMVGLADYSSYEYLKPFFHRLRPCKVLDAVRIIDGCAGWEGFPSNHAANAMVATTIALFYGSRKVWGPMLAMALVVGLSRMYLGVHYPIDVLAGYLYGAMLGLIGVVLREKVFSHPLFKEQMAKLARRAK